MLNHQAIYSYIYWVSKWVHFISAHILDITLTNFHNLSHTRRNLQ